MYQNNQIQEERKNEIRRQPETRQNPWKNLKEVWKHEIEQILAISKPVLIKF